MAQKLGFHRGENLLIFFGEDTKYIKHHILLQEVEKKFIDLAITKTEQTIVDIETKIKEQDHQDLQAEKDEEVPLNPLPQSKFTTKWVKELGAVGDSGNSGGVGGGGGGTEKYLFYQSEDGQMIFANAFTIKCMLKVRWN